MKTTSNQTKSAALSDYIVTDREILGGEPVFRGTRVPVASLFEHLESDCSLDEFLENFPTVTREAAVAVLMGAQQLALEKGAAVKVLVDECVPLKLVRLLTGHTFDTAQQKGWGGFKNGRLLTLAEPEFDLFLTSDRNLQYQQNLKGRKIAVLLLSTNHWPTLKKQAPLVQAALDKIRPDEFVRVEIPK